MTLLNEQRTESRAAGTGGTWAFLTNYAHVLIVICRHPDIRVREIAARVGITERATMRIVGDLVEGGVLLKRRVGRENRYQIDRDIALRHPLESMHTVGELIDLLSAAEGASS